MRDGVEDCEFEVTGEFLPASLAVRDEDGDAIGEVTFAYRLACRSDVAAADQKLLLLEDGERYVLRGRATSPYEPYEPATAEPPAAQWPRSTYDGSMLRFRELPPELAGETTLS